MLSAPLRPFPDFLLIGAKRAGTTSLYRQIESHPQVLPLFPSTRFFPLRANMKGVHYFDTAAGHGVAWYRSHFASSFTRSTARRREGAAVTGEASPYYLFHPAAAGRAARLVPDAKLILLLRDPVERAHSHYREQCRNGVEHMAFEGALTAEPARLAGEAERLLHDVRAVSFAHEHQSYAAQSHYAASVERWLRHFPRDQLLVLCSEEYYADPPDHLDRVFAFLGLRAHHPMDLQPRNPAPPASMSVETRAALTARFEPDVARLVGVLGRSFPWPCAGPVNGGPAAPVARGHHEGAAAADA